MLVKKVNPEWKPAENPDLLVGETMEITDPKQLIIDGDVIGLGAHKEELSAFDLYGVLVKSELDEFREFNEMKKAKALKRQLETEQEDLQKLVKSLDKEDGKKEEVKVEAPTAIVESSTKIDGTTSFGDLRKEAVKRGLYKFGMSKSDLLRVLK